MLQKMILPKKLRTIHHPGKKVEIWMNDKKINTIHTLNHSEQFFMKQFINNLEDLGWSVLIEDVKKITVEESVLSSNILI
ncbi:MAG: hypothetical protein ACTSSO_01975 [Candidatus Hodarchaeales archaeon]